MCCCAYLYDDSCASLNGIACWLQARLSERVVVELINKLQELGFLEDKLLHSVHGRDYITPAQLCKEIQEQVQSSGGRLALVSLKPANLGSSSHAAMQSPAFPLANTVHITTSCQTKASSQVQSKIVCLFGFTHLRMFLLHMGLS